VPKGVTVPAFGGARRHRSGRAFWAPFCARCAEQIADSGAVVELWPKTASLSEDEQMSERISLEGKVAVVTGAGRGLGRAYVELLAERGARVVVNDRGTDVSGFGKDATIAEEVADVIRSRGGEAIANDSDGPSLTVAAT
jgi:hypothetical protein